MFEQKLKASLIHLFLSIFLIFIVIGSIIFFLYPRLFISVTDFREVASLIITIDIVLGPLLTFVVFKPKKKTLKFDLSIIAAIQLLALIYGAYALYQVHPVFITFNIDRFTIVTARDSQPEKAKYDEYNVSKLTAGKLAYAKIPDDNDKRTELLFSAAMGGQDLDQRVDYYEPYEQNISSIIAKGLDPQILTSNADSNKRIKSFIDKHHGNIDNFVFLPITSPTKDAIIVLDKISAQPIATIDTDPWMLTKK